MKKLPILMMVTLVIVSVLSLMPNSAYAVNSQQKRTIYRSKTIVIPKSSYSIQEVHSGYGEFSGCKVWVAIDTTAHMWNFKWDGPPLQGVLPYCSLLSYWEVKDDKGFKQRLDLYHPMPNKGSESLYYTNVGTWTTTHVRWVYNLGLIFLVVDVNVIVYVGVQPHSCGGGGAGKSKWYGPFLI
jgi:hypothetical protein